MSVGYHVGYTYGSIDLPWLCPGETLGGVVGNLGGPDVPGNCRLKLSMLRLRFGGAMLEIASRSQDELIVVLP